MSATNHTTNYSLPQFIATDVPTWLVDVNGAFSDIDTAIHNAADAAGAASTLATTAKNKADAVEGALSTTNGNVTTLQTAVGAQQNAIAANTTKIGSAQLATVAQNLSGAVNELVQRIPSVTSACDLLGWFTDPAGQRTLNHAITDYRYVLLVGFASGVIYEMETIPVEILTTDEDLAGYTFCLDTHIGNTERRCDIRFDSTTVATSFNRSGLNIAIYGVR